MAHPEGTVSGVSVKFDMGWKGRLEKSIIDICCGTSGFLRWNLDTSHLEPLTSSASLHSSSLIPYPFHHTRYSSLPLNTGCPESALLCIPQLHCEPQAEEGHIVHIWLWYPHCRV